MLNVPNGMTVARPRAPMRFPTGVPVVYVLGPTSGSPPGWVGDVLTRLYRSGIAHAAYIEDWNDGDPHEVLGWYQRNIERAQQCGCVLIWLPAPIVSRANRPYALITMQKLGAFESSMHAGIFPAERIAIGIDHNIPTHPLIVGSFKLSVPSLTIHGSLEGTVREAAQKCHASPGSNE